MATSNVSNANGTNAALFSSINGTANAKASAADEMQNRFLHLLITQLKNQDPLNPTDANQMTAQLSQISTVSGIEKLNASMEKLLGSYAGSQSMQAAAMIGKTALSAGNRLQLTDDGAVGGLSLADAADKVVITIKDSTGKVVQSQTLKDLGAGVLNFAWDGKSDADVSLPKGDYTFSVKASQGDEEVEAMLLEAGTVNAVTLAANGTSLQMTNGKTVAYSDILQIMN
jgi:flagellar basal-body rod modification protein FlgD